MFVPENVDDSLRFLDFAFEWGEKYELRILLAVFGLPGSQNGLVSSGCTTQGTSWVEEVNRALSLEALATLSDRYGNKDTLLGIEVMDRPSDALVGDVYYNRLLNAYYQHSYEVIRSRSMNAAVVFNEPIVSNLSEWRSIFPEPTYFNVALDIHLYTESKDLISANYSKIIASTDTWARYISTESSFKPIIVGEWSLNAKIGDTGQISRRSKQELVNAQQAAMSEAFGSFLWTWKVEEGLNEEDSLQNQLTNVNGLRLS